MALAAPATIRGQRETAQTFEVASVKPAGPDGPLGRGVFNFPGGRIVANGCTLEKLIEEAYNIEPYQLSGGPHWIHADHYDVVAKPPESSIVSKLNPASPRAPLTQEQRAMLQALLAERFHLRIRHESTEGRVFLLVKGGSEPKLQPARNLSGYSWVGGASGGAIIGDGLQGTNATMEELARRLSIYLEHPVFDRTGLRGAFDFRYEYHSGEAQPDLVTSIVASLQGLGLKLEPAKGMVNTLIIDEVARPTLN